MAAERVGVSAGRALMLGSVLSAIAPAADAFVLEHAVTAYEDGRFSLTLEAQLEAPLAAVMRVLRDYEAYPELDPRVRSARVLERIDSHTVLLQTEVSACVTFVCRTVSRVERVSESQRELLALTVSERSDVAFGRTQTTLSVIDERTTRVVYRTAVEPHFWIPRFMARRAALNSLREGTIDLFERVEATARQLESAHATH